MLSPLELGRPALFVIRQSQSQGRHSQAIEDATGLNVTIRLRIPLWQDHNGRTRFVPAFAARSKQPRMNGIVFGRRRMNGTGPCQVVARQLPVVNFRQRKEFVASGHDAPRVRTKDGFWIVTVYMFADE